MKLNQGSARLHAVTLALLCAGTLAATAAFASPASEARALYQRELAVCTGGTSNQDRQTCVKEAKAAYAQNLRGDLADAGARYERNANDRCDALSGDQKVACTARMQGSGTTSGTAAGGGIYRELVTREVAPPAGNR